jgi:hypothetical protein
MSTNSGAAMDLAVARPGPQKNVLRIPEHVRTTHGADGATVLDILHGQMFRLNYVGSRILELVKQGLTTSEIAEHLAREFGIERIVADADVRDFVEILEKHRLLTMQADSLA